MIDQRGAARTVSRGLTRPSTRGNTLIVYSARDGTTADDGKGANSPFTEALLKHIEGPDLEIALLFRHVRDDVIAATGPNDPQEPFTYGSLSAKPIFLRKVAAITVPRRQLEIPLDEYRTHFRTALLRPEWDQRVEAARKSSHGRAATLRSSRTEDRSALVRDRHPQLPRNKRQFDAHFHNGDPLTDRTKRVPAGRPKEGDPPFTWEQSAEDAIRSTKLDSVPVWTSKTPWPYSSATMGSAIEEKLARLTSGLAPVSMKKALTSAMPSSIPTRCQRVSARRFCSSMRSSDRNLSAR